MKYQELLEILAQYDVANVKTLAAVSDILERLGIEMKNGEIKRSEPMNIINHLFKEHFNLPEGMVRCVCGTYNRQERSTLIDGVWYCIECKPTWNTKCPDCRTTWKLDLIDMKLPMKDWQHLHEHGYIESKCNHCFTGNLLESMEEDVDFDLDLAEEAAEEATQDYPLSHKQKVLLAQLVDVVSQLSQEAGKNDQFNDYLWEQQWFTRSLDEIEAELHDELLCENEELDGLIEEGQQK